MWIGNIENSPCREVRACPFVKVKEKETLLKKIERMKI
jgi:hypothetical protein